MAKKEIDTGINTGTDPAVYYMSTDDPAWTGKLKRLAEKRPDEMIIWRLPEENDKCICVTFPKKWLKISPPRHVSDEQRKRMSERMLSR